MFSKTIFKKFYRTQRHTPVYVSWGDVRSVVVLLHSASSSYQDVLDIVARLEQDNKTVTTYYLADNKRMDIACLNSDIRVVTKKDVGCFKKPKSGVVECQGVYDLVIDLTLGHTLVTDYIVAMHNAKLVCGGADEERLVRYDFQIATDVLPDKSSSSLLAQIVKYLSIIQSEK